MFDANSSIYDKPGRTAAVNNYIICSTPRSGSTLLCRALWETGQAGFPHEYFHSTKHMPILKKRWHTKDFCTYLQELKIKRSTRNGVFGCKVHFQQYQHQLQGKDLHSLLPNPQFIYIHREDHLRQAISLARGIQTKQWCSDEIAQHHPVFDRILIDECLKRISYEEKGWKNFFVAHQISPMFITYEDFIAAYAETIKMVLQHIGVKQIQEIPDYPIQKMADHINEEWYTRYLKPSSDSYPAAIHPAHRSKNPPSIEQVGPAPDISVVIFNYNFGPFIKECIESILMQNLAPREICIYDDCSTDHSWEIIDSFYNQYPNLINTKRNSKNIGMIPNVNNALKHAKGEWITWIDGDDRWLPDKLYHEWQTLNHNPQAKIAFSNVSMIDTNGKHLSFWDNVESPKAPQGDIFFNVFSKIFFPNSGSVFRNHIQHRCVFNTIGYMDENLSLYIDWDYKIRATKHFLCTYTPEPTVEYRIHSGGIHNLAPSVHYNDVISIFKKHVKLIKNIPAEKQSIIINNIAKQIRSFNPKVNPISILSPIVSELGLRLSIEENIRPNQPSFLSKLPAKHSSKTIRPSKSENMPLQDTTSQGIKRESLSDHSHLIFLISLPRSGSTLLQRILSGHTDIHTTAEPWFMLHPLHAFKTKNIICAFDENLAANATQDFLSTIPENMELYFQAVRAYGLTLYNRALEVSGKRLFLDKTPRYYSIIPELSRTFPNSRFIILLRNPLAVMSSVLRTWFRNDPKYLSRTSNQRDIIEGPRCLIDGLGMFENRAHVVHYESLVSDPEKVIGNLCDYLEIPFSKEMLNYGNRKAPCGRFGDNVGINRHNRPVNDSINKWLNNLTSPTLRPYAVDYLHRLGHETVTRMGYDFDAIASTLHTDGNRSGNMIIGSQESPAESFLLPPQNGIKKRYEQLLASLKGEEGATITEGLQQFLTMYPEFPEAHNDLGVLYGEVGAYDQAYEHYQKAVALDSHNITFQKNLADFQYFVKKDIPSALDTYTTLLKNNPVDTEVLYAIGYISAELGKRDDAHVFFNRILEIDPMNYEARCFIGSKPNEMTKTSRLSENESAKYLASNNLLQTNSPVVSAIVSVYNAEKYLEGCLEDLLSQSIAQKVEIIIVDSGSQEKEYSIAHRFRKRYNNIQYIRTENRETVYAAWNRAIKRARGKYITNANADDRHRSDAFEIMARILDQKPEIALVYADCLITETENEAFDNCKPIGTFKWHDWDRSKLLFKGCFMGPQPMWRRSLHDEYGYFDPEYVTSGDYEFWLRISQTHDFYHISEYLGLYLRSPKSIEHSNREKQTVENKRLLNMYRKASARKKIIRKTTFLNASETKNDNSFTIENLNQTILLFEKEEYVEAVTNLHHFLSDHPDHWVAYELLVDVMLQAGHEMDIKNQLQPLENRSDLPPKMIALIGHGYEASGNLEKAAIFVDKAIIKDPECARAWNLKGVIAYRNNQSSEAAHFFQKASECDENWGDPLTNMGTIHWDQSAYDKALECYEIGFQLSPIAPNVATTYHMAIAKTGHYERAKPLFKDVVLHHPDFRKGRFLLIDILIHMEAYQEALIQIEAVLVRFGTDQQMLEAAKAVRDKIGPMTIAKSKRPSLSLCMILKNEEKYLPRCLESLKPIVDEIIVVDTGSEDATRDIATVFGAKVFEYKWNDNFAAARNHSLEKATGDWILVMDADEFIASSDYDSILNRIRKYKNEKVAFLLTTRNYISGYNGVGWVGNDGAYGDIEAGCGWVPSTKARLFKNFQQVRFEYPVHELVDPSLERNGFRTISCQVPVHHYGCLESEHIADKETLYNRISKRKLKEMQHDPKVLKELSVRANMLGNYDEAIHLWSRLVKIQPNNANAFINLSATFDKLGRYMKAKAAAQRAIKIAPGIKEGYLNLGRSEFFLGNFSIACEIFSKAIRIEQNYYSAIFLLGVSEICNAEKEKGMSTISQLKALSIWSSLTYAIQDLAETLSHVGFKKQAQDLTRCASGLNLVDCSDAYDISISEAVKPDDSLANLSMAS
jgi:glycosyltransferase involved in cell wall biosynthesis/LPS sulfotransferase NodH